MEKNVIRKMLIAKMIAHDKVVKARRDEQLLWDVLRSSAYQDSQVIATYLSFSHEFATLPLIKQALVDGKTVLIPKTYPKGRMIFGEYKEDELIQTNRGLFEPESEKAFSKDKIDFIHVPGVAFNEKGFRIGYGAGYYDRYLTGFSGTTVSTIYDFQRYDFEEEKHDIAVREVFVR
ncbi:5-formyltetrahydrofolate cyclo-ligase [Streptococcus sciuri]|uniref:5-formyltetrahydrofolate cyclo-ligase n=1 Tax=Streptococcus sciuri TaxID=2973939 RepID=A0ABT2F7S5_9STRE|nr:5-formyltetrahydrofolate cyclo-ligase [Streptococcus sciuri]MCS4488507.1 5-formyltetrahydrofolate cyclo-ligase [Streptococcus sciuri]